MSIYLSIYLSICLLFMYLCIYIYISKIHMNTCIYIYVYMIYLYSLCIYIYTDTCIYLYNISTFMIYTYIYIYIIIYLYLWYTYIYIYIHTIWQDHHLGWLWGIPILTIASHGPAFHRLWKPGCRGPSNNVKDDASTMETSRIGYMICGQTSIEDRNSTPMVPDLSILRFFLCWIPLDIAA